MTDKIEPVWTWDEEAEAGYIDFDPGYRGRRRTRSFKVSGALSVLVDLAEDGEIVGIEVLI